MRNKADFLDREKVKIANERGWLSSAKPLICKLMNAFCITHFVHGFFIELKFSQFGNITIPVEQNHHDYSKLMQYAFPVFPKFDCYMHLYMV